MSERSAALVRKASSRCHRAYRADEVLVGLALEHVARGAGPQGFEDVVLVVVHREDEHAGVGELGADLAGGLQAGQAGHAHVEDAQVGPRLEGQGHRLGAVLGLGDDLEPAWRSSSRRMPARTIP